jgi:DNA-binding transcriptional LysR family regulator
MTLDQMSVFIAVAEREHVTRAAEALNLTQSAASAAIAALERELGTKLFHRVGRGITLTEGGRFFLTEARAILNRVEAASSAMKELSGLKRGRITIKASQTIANHYLPPRLFAFHRTYPGIVLAVSIGNSAQVARAITEGEVELGLIEGPLGDTAAPHLATELIAEDRMVLVVAAGHPWARKRKFTPQDFAEAVWVVREAGSGTRAIFQRALATLGVPAAALNVAIELPSNEAILSAVQAGAGASVLSESVCADSLAAGHLRRLPVALESRPFHAVQHADRYRSRAVSALLAMLKEGPGA